MITKLQQFPRNQPQILSRQKQKKYQVIFARVAAIELDTK